MLDRATDKVAAADRTEFLKDAGVKYPVEHCVVLQIFYLGMFSSAEMAFVLMALREYALDVAKIPEIRQLFPDMVAENSAVVPSD